MSNCISPKRFMVSPFAAERRTGVKLMDRLGARLCGNIVSEVPVSIMKLIVLCPILVATSNSCELFGCCSNSHYKFSEACRLACLVGKDDLDVGIILQFDFCGHLHHGLQVLDFSAKYRCPRHIRGFCSS